MPVISWKEEYSVGVAELDGHHKKLINMINELHLAMNSDRGQRLVSSIIKEMVDYARKHFEIEEGYMRQCEYLGLLGHFREHENFVKKARELEKRSREGEFVLSLEVIQFLSDWLKKHILETDMKYVPLFRDKGLR